MSKPAVAWVTDPDFLQHASPNRTHVERPNRLAKILSFFSESGMDARLQATPYQPADTSLLAAIHAKRQIDFVRELATLGGGQIDDDTYVTERSYELALRAAGAAVAAATVVWKGDALRAFAAVRPPGHHATDTLSMGFCLFNNVALAAEALRREGAERVYILDWDVHHGNGTQDIFYDRRDVMFCSLHQAGIYPGTGAPEETGNGDGIGYTINVPLPGGAGDETLIRCFDEVVEPTMKRFRPDCILLSAGYDAHLRDPLGGLTVTTNGFFALSQRIVALADELCDGRLVATLEGGYDLKALASSTHATLAAFLDDTELGATDANEKRSAEPDVDRLLARVREVHGL